MGTGQRLSYFQGTGVRRVAYTTLLFEGTTSRMHVLAFADTWDMRSTAPSDLRILTYDFRSGTQTNELSLADLDLGVGLSDLSGSVRSTVGWDISPDGSQIAIMPANESGIRLIETTGMTLVGEPRTLEPIAATSTPIAVPGECVGMEQLSYLAFAPDGRTVYASWTDYACIDGAAVEYRTAGVRSIDVYTGTESRSATTAGWYILMRQASSASVYAINVALPTSDELTQLGDLKITAPTRLTLARLDAATLEIEAERPLNNDFMFAVIVP